MLEVVIVKPINDHVSEIIINRPDHYNSFNTELRLKLVDAIRSIEKILFKSLVLIFAVNLLPVYPPIIPPITITKIGKKKLFPSLKSLAMYVRLLPVATNTTASEDTPVFALNSDFVR